MKVLLLTANYNGRYADKEGHILLPQAVLGTFLEKDLPLDVIIPEKVDMGELEGKHSECYGDLKVEIIDLDETPINQVEGLINLSDYGVFEIFVDEWRYRLQDSAENRGELNAERSKLYDALGIEHDGNYFNPLDMYYAFEALLKEKYKAEKTTITINTSDLETVKVLLEKNNIPWSNNC